MAEEPPGDASGEEDSSGFGPRPGLSSNHISAVVSRQRFSVRRCEAPINQAGNGLPLWRRRAERAANGGKEAAFRADDGDVHVRADC